MSPFPMTSRRLTLRDRTLVDGYRAVDPRVERRISDLFERAASVDQTLREHSRNVAALSIRVGADLGMEEQELELLGLAATVHDVGKVSVPPAILAKEGPLDSGEWKEMRAHSAAGADLLAACAAPTAILQSVRSHHERWDGRGYPDRLKGETIPLAARIIAVADAYWAMVEARPYRPPRRPISACHELVVGAGTQFDSDCVRVTCRILAETI